MSIQAAPIDLEDIADQSFVVEETTPLNIDLIIRTIFVDSRSRLVILDLT